jgi:hypothetical protein
MNSDIPALADSENGKITPVEVAPDEVELAQQMQDWILGADDRESENAIAGLDDMEASENPDNFLYDVYDDKDEIMQSWTNVSGVVRASVDRNEEDERSDDKSTPSRLPASASGSTGALNTAFITSNSNDPPKPPAAATDIGSPVNNEPVIVRATSPIPPQAPFTRPSASIKEATEVSAPAPDAEQVKVRAKPAAASRPSGDHIFHTIEAVVKARPKKLRQIDDSTNISTSSTSTLDMASVTSVQAGAKRLAESAPSNVSVSDDKDNIMQSWTNVFGAVRASVDTDDENERNRSTDSAISEKNSAGRKSVFQLMKGARPASLASSPSMFARRSRPLPGNRESSFKSASPVDRQLELTEIDNSDSV